MSSLFDRYDQYMVLNLFIDDTDPVLLQKYCEAIEKHNAKVLNDPYPDAGFDLFVPKQRDDANIFSTTFNHYVKCSAVIRTSGGRQINTGYYLYPRSSVSKTGLRLANSVGIIDSGYRNHLIAVFDEHPYKTGESRTYTRLVQICAPALMPIVVIRVDSAEELDGRGIATSRNLGGFGSTGL
jgi:dUTP pyrophosphatase